MEPYTYISVQGDFDVEGIAEQLRPVVEDYVEWVAHPEWQQPTDDSPAWELLDYHELCSVVEPFAGHYGSHGGGYDWDEDGEANLIREFQIEQRIFHQVLVELQLGAGSELNAATKAVLLGDAVVNDADDVVQLDFPAAQRQKNLFLLRQRFADQNGDAKAVEIQHRCGAARQPPA